MDDGVVAAAAATDAVAIARLSPTSLRRLGAEQRRRRLLAAAHAEEQLEPRLLDLIYGELTTPTTLRKLTPSYTDLPAVLRDPRSRSSSFSLTRTSASDSSLVSCSSSFSRVEEQSKDAYPIDAGIDVTLLAAAFESHRSADDLQLDE